MARTKSTEPAPIYRIKTADSKGLPVEWIVCSKTQAGRICSLKGANVVLDAQRVEDNGGFQVAAIVEIDLIKMPAPEAAKRGLELLGVEF